MAEVATVCVVVAVFSVGGFVGGFVGGCVTFVVDNIVVAAGVVVSTSVIGE